MSEIHNLKNSSEISLETWILHAQKADRKSPLSVTMSSGQQGFFAREKKSAVYTVFLSRKMIHIIEALLSFKLLS